MGDIATSYPVAGTLPAIHSLAHGTGVYISVEETIIVVGGAV